MIIIFDIDDTITNETSFIIKYAPNYLKKKYKIDVRVRNSYAYGVSEIFGLKEIFNTLNEEDIIKKCQEINNKFWVDNWFKYLFYPIKKDARKIIEYFNNQNYTIYFVTLRGTKINELETKLQKLIRVILVSIFTKLQLKMNNISYEDIFLAESIPNKIDIINSLTPNYVFDDLMEVLEGLDSKIIPICIKTPHNILLDGNNRIIKTFLNFNDIVNLIDNKENDIVRKRIR